MQRLDKKCWAKLQLRNCHMRLEVGQKLELFNFGKLGKRGNHGKCGKKWILWLKKCEQSWKWGIANPVKVWNSPCCALLKLHIISSIGHSVFFSATFPCFVPYQKVLKLMLYGMRLHAWGPLEKVGWGQLNIFMKCCSTSKKVLFCCKIKLLLGEKHRWVGCPFKRQTVSLCMRKE